MDRIAIKVAVAAGAASRDALQGAVLAILDKAEAMRAEGGIGRPLADELLVTLAGPLGLPIEFGPFGALVDGMTVEPIADLAPTISAAFDAAYEALMPHTHHAQVRADIAEHVTRLLLDRRNKHGMGYMLAVAQAVNPEARGTRSRWALIDELQDGPAGRWATASSVAALDDAVRAVARVLAEG